jgi:hypothetical protein
MKSDKDKQELYELLDNSSWTDDCSYLDKEQKLEEFEKVWQWIEEKMRE